MKTSDINIKEEIWPSSKTTFLINLQIIKHRTIFKVKHLKIISKIPKIIYVKLLVASFQFPILSFIWREVIILHSNCAVLKVLALSDVKIKSINSRRMERFTVMWVSTPWKTLETSGFEKHQRRQWLILFQFQSLLWFQNSINVMSSHSFNRHQIFWEILLLNSCKKVNF